MIEKNYKKTVDNQHASEELIQKTLSRLKEEQEKENTKTEKLPDRKASRRQQWGVWGSVAAACIIVVAGIYTGMGHFPVHYVKVQQSAAEDQAMNFGQEAKLPGKLADGIKYRAVSSEYSLPEGLLSAEAETIHGKSVYFGENVETQSLYAAYQDENQWILAESAKLSKREFYRAIKTQIDSGE